MSGEQELKPFDFYWTHDGIDFDPDPNVSWFDKRTEVAQHAFDAGVRHGRATPPGVEMVPEGTIAKLLEASNHLAWAAEVEIQVGRRPRAFVRQHRAKVRFWIDSVRAILTAHRATKETPNAQG